MLEETANNDTNKEVRLIAKEASGFTKVAVLS